MFALCPFLVHSILLSLIRLCIQDIYDYFLISDIHLCYVLTVSSSVVFPEFFNLVSGLHYLNFSSFNKLLFSDLSHFVFHAHSKKTIFFFFYQHPVLCVDVSCSPQSYGLKTTWCCTVTRGEKKLSLLHCKNNIFASENILKIVKFTSMSYYKITINQIFLY